MSSAATLVAWFDGNDINGDGTTVANGATLSTWKDKSGKGHDATGSGAVVMSNALNGLTVVDLRGQTSMLFPLGSSTTSYTIFTVQYGKVMSGNEYQRLLNGYSDFILLYGFQIGSTHWMTNYIDGSNLDTNTPVIDMVNRWSIADLVVSGDTKTSISAVDGTLQDSRSWSTIRSLETVQIGTWSTIQYWQGYVAEILVYTGTVNDSDRQRVEGYLAWKWGLQSSLPVSHPYKSSPPYGSITNNFIIYYHYYHYYHYYFYYHKYHYHH